MQVPVSIAVDGKNIMGVLHVPQNRQNTGATPVIIMCYGLNGNRVEVHRMSVLLGREAEKNGVFLLRFDYRGLGVSDGEFWESSIQQKVRDVLAGIDFVRGCFHDEKISITLLGYSDGARIALNVSQKSKYVDSLCMWSPVLVPNSSYFLSRTKMKLFREPISKAIVCKFFGLWMGTDYMRDINTNNSAEEFRNFPGPSLCIFGDKDQLAKDTRDIISGFRDDVPMHNVPSHIVANIPEIIVIPEAKHMYGRSQWTDEVISETVKWVKGIS